MPSQQEGVWHGRIPMSVLGDPKLSHTAKIVYAVIAAHVWQGNTARIGQRRIAKLCCMHPETANSATRELVSSGHARMFNEGRSRRMYVLLSPVFGQKTGNADTVVSGPSGGPRLATVRSKIA